MRTELLEVGARLMVSGPYSRHGCRHTPGTVARKTPKGIITVTVDAYPPHGTISHEVTFNPDGWERGQKYHGRKIEPFDQKVLDEEIRREEIRKKRDRLEDWRLWRNLPEDLVCKVCDLLDTHQSSDV